MRRFVLIGPSLVVLFTIALTLVAGPNAIRQMHAAQTAAQVTLAQQRLDSDNLLERINRATRDIADAVEPSVVFIRAEATSGGRRFFPSQGSGWVYDDDGHIVTNNHVVANASDISVQFSDGRVRDGRVVSFDPSTDIAVIRVNDSADLIFPARRATGDSVHQGETVFAFGSPFGYKFSMSQGIVSGLGRHAVAGRGSDRYTNFIQTDAAVNPGNSGGPLVDVKGRVVGMNTAIITDESRTESGARNVTGVSGGIGFAIPLQTIESVVDQLIERGEVRKGYLGVRLMNPTQLNRQALLELGYDGQGVVIGGIQQGTPAAESGLSARDVITHIDGEETPNMSVLRSVIGHRPPGEEVTLTVWRDGEMIEINVTLAAATWGNGGLELVAPDDDSSQD